MFSKVLPLNIPDQGIGHDKEKVSALQRYWYIWVILAFGMFLLQASTIGILPSLMQDEAQITDYGRLALNPVSRWSVTWWVAGNKPLFLWSYLGPLIAEFGYQIGGASGVGPRLMALLGGLTAAIMALGWLLQRKVPAIFAGLLAFAFLLDPLFTLSQRMARSDSWVMAFCLASCWLLRMAPSKHGLPKVLLITLSGAFAAAAAFVWPSAVFLYPLICLEFFHAAYDRQSTSRPWKQMMQHALHFFLGGLLISIVLILPIRYQLPMISGDMKNMVALNVNASKTPAERILTLISYQPWAKLIKAFAKTLSPFLPLLALWALLFRREKGIVLASIFTLSIILMTLVYEFRLVYLLPYFLAMSGDLFQRLQVKSLQPAIRLASITFLVLVVAWSIGISIFLRTALAFSERSSHDRNLITDAATSAIGRGNYKVFLAFTYEFYFTGRSLGWQLYTPYIQFTYDAAGNWIRKDDYQPKDKFISLMSKMDYAIFQDGTMNDDIRNQLQLSGLSYSRTIHMSEKSLQNIDATASGRMRNIILWFLRGADTYGPYRLYARVKANAGAMQAPYPQMPFNRGAYKKLSQE
jgi:hypothetical protein